MMRLRVLGVPQPYHMIPNAGDQHGGVDFRPPSPRNNAPQPWDFSLCDHRRVQILLLLLGSLGSRRSGSDVVPSRKRFRCQTWPIRKHNRRRRGRSQSCQRHHAHKRCLCKQRLPLRMPDGCPWRHHGVATCRHRRARHGCARRPHARGWWRKRCFQVQGPDRRPRPLGHSRPLRASRALDRTTDRERRR